jgi:Glycine rich protein
MSAKPSGDPGAASPRSAGSALKLTAAGATIAFVLAGTAVPAAAAERSGDCAPALLGTVTCVYDRPAVSNYVFRVPAGVTEVHIDARGAGGGDGGTINFRRPAPQGAPGGLVAADFPVTPGDVLRILVGGHGKDAEGMKPGAGGLNGGANGGVGAPAGGGGGGSSSVLLNGTDHLARILVAGGGGGAGGAVSMTAVSSTRGGAGGGYQGEDGLGDDVGKGGIGAVGPSGGAGLQRITGVDGHSGYDARFGGTGGEGGFGTSNSFQHEGTWGGGPVGGGGGGGGYAGGSGGSAGTTIGGGGGGGSGFVATSVLAPSVARLGSARLFTGTDRTSAIADGVVIITYQVPTDRHDRHATPAAPARSAAATSHKRG